MALLALAAFIGLAAISGSSATCVAEGSSAVGGLLVDITGSVTGGTTLGTLAGSPDGVSQICPDRSPSPPGLCYGGNGSGSGRNWMKGSSAWYTAALGYQVGTPGAALGPVAFSDNSYSGAQLNAYGDPNPIYKNGVKPASITEFPIAIGAIAIYRNSGLTGIPVNACLCKAALCKLFSAATDHTALTWAMLGAACGASWPATPVRLVIRGDSSGSTDATVAYLKQPTVCGSTFTFVTPATPGVANAIKTGGVVGYVRSTPGSVTYAVCGQTGVTEFAVQNQRGSCVKCHQCITVPSPTAQCGIYSQFKIATKLCDWTGVQPNGDKDFDKDGLVDLDNDSDGVGLYDFPTVFLEYAMMPVTVQTFQKPCCQLLQRMLAFLFNVKTQGAFSKYGFYPLPSYVLAASCKCMSLKSCGIAWKGVYSNGVCA